MVGFAGAGFLVEIMVYDHVVFISVFHQLTPFYFAIFDYILTGAKISHPILLIFCFLILTSGVFLITRPDEEGTFTKNDLYGFIVQNIIMSLWILSVMLTRTYKQDAMLVSTFGSFVGAIILGIWCCISYEFKTPSNKIMMYCIILGFLGAVNTFGDYEGFKRAPVISASLLYNTFPAWTFLVQSLAFHIRPTVLQIVGVLISFCGVSLYQFTLNKDLPHESKPN